VHSRSYPQPVETVDLQLIQLPAMDDLNELSPVPAGLDGRSPWWARELLATLHADSARNPEGRRRTPRNAWRAYLTGDGMAIYCPKCALGGFGPRFASRSARPS